MLFRFHYRWLLILASLGAHTSAHAVLNLSQVFTNGSNDQFFSTDITNNTGVTLDSATLDFSAVFTDVGNLSWNVAAYDGLNGGTVDGIVTLSEFIPELKSNNLVTFTIDNIGDVHSGWSGNIGNDGVINLDNNGIIPGDTYDIWSNTLTMETFLGIDNSLLTDPATSTIVPITLSTTQTITDFATGTSGASVITADGFAYEVVPEPASFGWVLGLATLGMVATRRQR